MRSLQLVRAAIALSLLVASTAAADSPFNAKGSLRDNLNALLNAKKPVVVILKGGQSYTATVDAVGDHYVVLTQPSGKEYYDVLVSIEEIAALEARAR